MSEFVNPYHPGEPVNDPTMLFGRQEAADWIERQIISQTRSMILSGQPLVGKTSFIRQVGTLQNFESINSTISLTEIPMGSASEPLPDIDTVLQKVLEQLIPQLALFKLTDPHQVIPTTYTSTALRQLFGQIDPQLNQTPLILYIDDLHHLITEDLALVATFLSAFTPILDECRNLHLVFTLNQGWLDTITHPLLDEAPIFQINPLAADAAIDMITLPVKNVLRFDYGITRRISEINSHHPYYLSLFCQTLLNRQMQDGWVNQRDFDGTLAEILDNPVEPFSQLWEQSSWSERAVLTGMAAIQGKHGPMTHEEIVRFLRRLDSRTAPEVVVQALQSLAQRGVLVLMGAVSYRFHVELLRYWLREHTVSAEILRKVDWGREATKIRATSKPDQVSVPPLAIQPTRPSLGRRLFWPVVITLFSLLCLAGLGTIFAVQFLNIPLFGSETSTEAVSVPADNQGVEGDVSSTANEEVVVAPEIIPTATPTPPLVVAKSLPAITYMGKDIDQTWRVYVMEADGSNALAISPDGVDDTAPTWSPDGSRIAFVSQRDGNREIYVMNADGQNVINISRHPADDWTPAWSPDGSQLTFSSLRDGGWEIFIVETACFATPESCPNSLTQITFDQNGNISPVWSP
ncbi:MAG: hypothetical protein AAF485_17095, partial [Chloroflexota bacterium]